MADKIIERKDISDKVYKQWGGNINYAHKHVEVDGILYMEYSDHYESCSQGYLDLYKINEFKQSSRCEFLCKCLNGTKFKIYVEGYEGKAICLECGMELLV